MGKTRLVYFAFNPSRFKDLVTFMIYRNAQFYDYYYVYGGRHYIVIPGVGIEIPSHYVDNIINQFQLKKKYVMKHAEAAKLIEAAKTGGLLIVSNSLEKIRSAVHTLISSQI